MPLALVSRLRPIDVLVGLVLAAVAARFALAPVWRVPAVQAWTTVFVAICVQASPYLVLGALTSAAVTALVPASWFARALPSRPSAAVVVAGAAGAVLPGCECGSVPVAASLLRRGVPFAPAVAFLLAAPAINPVVLVATAVAFPGRPDMVLARFVASLATAVVTGWVWLRCGRGAERGVRPPAGRPHEHQRWAHARDTAAHDLARSFGLLVIGAAAAATIETAVPPTWLTTLGGSGAASVLGLAVLAVLTAVCSEADAFVAASFVRFRPVAQLAFMVVGPMVDLKLIAMQAGTFGTRVAVRLVPLTFVVALAATSVTGWWLL